VALTFVAHANKNKQQNDTKAIVNFKRLIIISLHCN